MIIELPREIERLGHITFHGVQKVLELDSGLRDETVNSGENPLVKRIPYEAFQHLEKQMAIIVPVRNERIRLLEGVLCGIPHHCLTIVVSNSSREPIDRFYLEQEGVERNRRFTQKNAIVVHQKDPDLAEALADAGYTELLDEQGLVKDGKAEGMILATLLARLSGRKFVGFIDSDNYVPGAVHEYIREYSAGLLISNSPYTMVRIRWHSKPKVQNSRLFFAKWGRASIHTNQVLNRLISHYTGFGTDIIKTGNAGEHALTTELAMQMGYSSGYSIEPYHFIWLMENFGGVTYDRDPVVMRRVELYQIESRNPHLHELKTKEHVEKMSYEAMQVIYHSRVFPGELRQELLQEMTERGLIKEGEELNYPVYYPSLTRIDLLSFLDAIQNQPYAELLDPSLIDADDQVPDLANSERHFRSIPREDLDEQALQASA